MHSKFRTQQLRVPCGQTRKSTRACGSTHSRTSVSYLCNLPSDTWQSTNNYKAIRQASADGVEIMREMLRDEADDRISPSAETECLR